MNESYTDALTCCLCGGPVEDERGKDPEPLASKGRCCADCHFRKVVPARENQLSMADDPYLEEAP